MNYTIVIIGVLSGILMLCVLHWCVMTFIKTHFKDKEPESDEDFKRQIKQIMDIHNTYWDEQLKEK